MVPLVCVYINDFRGEWGELCVLLARVNRGESDMLYMERGGVYFLCTVVYSVYVVRVLG